MSVPETSLTSPLRRLAIRTASHLAGGPLTASARAFLKNFGYLFSSDLIATVLTFFFSAWIIRAMGPTEFGVANLAISASQLVLIPMLFGLHASTSRAVAASSEPGTVLGSSLLLMAGLIPIVALAGLLLSGPITGVMGLSQTVFLWSLPLAAVLVMQQVLQGMLNGLHRFRKLSEYNIWSAGIYAGLIVTGLIAHIAWTAWLYIVVTGARALALALFCLASIRRDLRRPSREAMRSLAHFGGVYTVGSVAYFFALSAIDSLMLNAYHGPTAVGLYGAYFTTFNIIVSRVVKFVSDVLLPTATAHGQPSRIVGRLTRVLFGPAWLIVPVTMVLSRLLFFMYGDAYVFSWTTAALLGLCIYLHVGVSLSSDLMLAGGMAGLRMASALAIVTAIVNVGGNLLLIPPFGVAGSLLATASSSAVGLILRLAYLRRERNRMPAA